MTAILPYPVVDNTFSEYQMLSTDFFEKGAILLLDKPKGWTSFDVVNKIRRMTQIRKAGHCGTLDPMATGLLILLTGKATKSMESLMIQDKTYEAVFTLGVETDTYDEDGKPIRKADVPNLSYDEWHSILQKWNGRVVQSPPPFSAIKRNGIPLYQLARRGIAVHVEPRTVVIHDIQIIDWQSPNLHLRVQCGKGTYIRSLAHDIGSDLGCGAMVSHLRRTAIGDYHVRAAVTLTELQAALLTEKRGQHAVH